MIDRGSLMARGLTDDTIARIYQSLYVYSKGFSEFLKDMTGVGTIVYINIWKVFSILLQSCSGGELDTIIATILA